MIGELSQAQIEHLIKTKSYGRLACQSDEGIYIVPISYVYDGEFIYGHSQEGMKISYMRRNPRVSMLIDEINTMNNWWSVMIQAEYEELDAGPLKLRALKMLDDRLVAISLSGALISEGGPSQKTGLMEKATQPIVFRLKLIGKSGRFEK